MLNILKMRQRHRTELLLAASFIVASCGADNGNGVAITASDEPGSAEIADARISLLKATEVLPDTFVSSVSAAIEQVPPVAELMPDDLNSICLSPDRISQIKQDVERFGIIAQDRIAATVKRSEDCAADGENCPDYGPESAALRVLNAHIARASVNVTAFSSGKQGPKARAALRGTMVYALESWGEWISAHNAPGDLPVYTLELAVIADSVADGADTLDLGVAANSERRLLRRASQSVSAMAGILADGASSADQGEITLSSDAYAKRLGARTAEMLRHAREAEAALAAEAQADAACADLIPDLERVNASRARLEQVMSICQADGGCVVSSGSPTRAEERVKTDRAAAVSSAFELLEGL